MKSLNVVGTNQCKASVETIISTNVETVSTNEKLNRYDINYQYSAKEMEMIKWFGFEKLVESLYPWSLYKMMVEKAFIDNDQSWWAHGLRRCIKALNQGNIYRSSKEWDDLIYLECPFKVPRKVKK